jgi:hypothetical protein
VLYRFSFDATYDFDPSLKVPIEIEKKSVQHSIKNFRRFHIFCTLDYFTQKNIFFPHDDDFKKCTLRIRGKVTVPGYTIVIMPRIVRELGWCLWVPITRLG